MKRPMFHEPRIGVSGFRYTPWRGVFYPAGLKQSDELAYLSRKLSSVELNGSFYSLQRPESYARWYAETPDGFMLALKGGRYVTHMKRLKGVEEALANFFASGVLCLGEKLGPILWQLPPTFAFDDSVLARFFDLLPRSLADVEKLAKRSPKYNSRAETNIPPGVPPRQEVRYALEVRHPSFAVSAFPELLKQHSIATCIADSAGRFPMIDEVTSDLVYLRLHGSKKLYESGYEVDELAAWAARVRAWSKQGLRTCVYFDNDAKVHAPFDALNLERIVKGERALTWDEARQAVEAEAKFDRSQGRTRLPTASGR